MVEIIKTSLVRDFPEGFLNNITIKTEYSSEDLKPLLENNVIPRYISFDGEGINLINNTKTFFTDGDFKGWVSNQVSNENAEFESDFINECSFALGNMDVAPTDFERVFKNITIAFSDDCCREIEVVYYCYTNSTSYTQIVSVDSNLLILTPPMDKIYALGGSIQRIKVNFLKTRIPHQQIKIYSIKFGESVVFKKIKSIELLEEISVISEDLPINELNFSVLIPDSNSTENIFKEDDLLNVYNNDTYYGTFYVIESERVSKNTYSVKAQNSISVLEKTMYREWGLSQTLKESESLYPDPDEIPSSNNIYVSGNYGMKLKDFKKVISVLSGIDIDVPDGDYLTKGYMPVNTCRYAMCLFAFANGLIIDSSRSDKISMLKIPKKISSTITNADKRIIGECILAKNSPITSAELQFTTYDSTNVGELENVIFKDDGSWVNNKGIISFVPEYPIEIEYNALADNFVLLLKSPNLVEFVIKFYNAADSDKNLKEFYLPTCKLIPIVENLEIINNITSKPNIKNFSNFPLKGDLTTLKENINTFIKSRGVVKGKIRLRGEKVGDLVQIETAYDGLITGIIQSMNIRFGYEDIAEIEVLEWPIG